MFGLFVSRCLFFFLLLGSSLFHAFLPSCVSFLRLPFCLSLSFVIHYAFIFMLFYHVTVSFEAGCISMVSCSLKRRLRLGALYFSVFFNLKRLLLPWFIINEGDLLLRGISLGMPLFKEFHPVKASQVRIGSLQFQCVSGNAFCCVFRS